MSAYQVIARKYRPQRFEEVVGQGHVTQTLAQAIEKDRIAHAYLFCGPRGTGKTTLARIFAKCLNCSNGPRSDFNLDDPRCQEIAQGRCLDVMEIDGASNRGIEEIRDLRETIHYAPAAAPFKIYIIDEVHMLTKEAFNALLKTLEEPPSHVKFMFATTEPDKVLPTILSRCQRFDLRRIPDALIVDQLKKIAHQEGVEIEFEALQAIARGADGGMRDAQSTLDQLISFCGESVAESDVLSMFGLTSRDQILSLSRAMVAQDKPSILQTLDDLIGQGKELNRLMADLQDHFRHLLLHKVSSSSTQLEGLSESARKMLQSQGSSLTETQILRLLEGLNQTEYRLKEASAKRIAVEVGLIRAAESLSHRGLDDILQALKKLKHDPSSTDRPPKDPLPVAEPPQKGSPEALPSSTPKQSVAEADAQKTAAPTEKTVLGAEKAWEALLHVVSKDSPFLHSYLLEAQALELSGNVLTAGFPAAMSNHMEMVDQRKHHHTLEACLAQLGHEGVGIKFILSKQVKAKAKPAAHAPDSEVPPSSLPQTGTPSEPSRASADATVPPDPKAFLEDPLIQKALETFKGRLINVESST